MDKEKQEHKVPDRVGFNSFYGLWTEFYGKYNWNNDFYPKLLLEVAAGQLFKQLRISKRNVVLDSRINLFVMQPSRTNKNGAIVPFDKVCRAMDALLTVKYPDDVYNRLRHNTIDELTDAGMFGSLDKVEREEREYDAAGKLIAKQKSPDYTQVEGLMNISKSDIITCQEAGILLKASQSGVARTIMEHINTALDSIHSGRNTVFKSMKGGIVECPTQCSLLLTTIPIDMVNITLLKSGFFRRNILWYNPLPVEIIYQNAKLGRSFVQQGIIDDAALVGRIADYLMEIREFMSGKWDSVVFTDEAKEALEAYCEKFEQENRAFSRVYCETLAPIFVDYADKCYIIASHSAILDRRTEVTKKDMEYAIDIINTLLVGISDYLYNSVLKETELDKLTDTQREITERLYEVLTSKKETTRKEFIRQLEQARVAKRTSINETITMLRDKKQYISEKDGKITKNDSWKM